MKKNKLALLASMGLASLVFLSGCVSVDRKTGNPTGLIWNLLGRPMGEAIKFFANNLGLGFGIGDYYRHLDRAVNHLATWFVPIMEGNLPI